MNPCGRILSQSFHKGFLAYARNDNKIMNLQSQIESLLFVSPKPLSVQKMASLTGASAEDVYQTIITLEQKYKDGGLELLHIGQSYQMASSPANAGVVSEFMQDEQSGELTRASLETLTIVAYRGPITRAEVEQIRGVNCAVILRHLLIRGLVEEKDDEEKMAKTYHITFDFLKVLGITKPEDLPDYDTLNSDENLRELVEAAEGEAVEEDNEG